MKNFFSFLKSKVLLINIGLSIVAVVVLLLLTNLILSLYTTQGRGVTMTDYRGMLVKEIEQDAKNAEFEVVVIDSVYTTDASMRPGAIVEQIPAAKKKVKKGRKIYVTINAFSREMTQMPALVNFSCRNALVNISNAGLSLGRIDTVASPYRDLVLKQKVDGIEVQPGMRLPKGSVVDLVVGRGDTGGVAYVPNVKGQLLEDVTEILQESRVTLGLVEYDETVRSDADTVRAVVYRQSPMPSGSQPVEAWTPVRVWLTIDMTKLSADMQGAGADEVSEEGDSFSQSIFE